MLEFSDFLEREVKLNIFYNMYYLMDKFDFFNFYLDTIMTMIDLVTDYRVSKICPGVDVRLTLILGAVRKPK